MKKSAYLLFLLVQISGSVSYAFDDLREVWNVDILYHYARTERSTLINSNIFQSRQGAMLQFEYEDQIDLFWRWYLGGDLTFAVYEAAASRSFSPREHMPWQLFLGTGFQLGPLKTFELFFGAGGSSETTFEPAGTNNFSLKQGISARVHAGVTWRFLGSIGSSSKLIARYSFPITSIDENGNPMSYRGIIDASLRIRGKYDSLMSFMAGVRFEDYRYSDQSVVYFTTRIYGGIGFHFK